MTTQVDEYFPGDLVLDYFCAYKNSRRSCDARAKICVVISDVENKLCLFDGSETHHISFDSIWFTMLTLVHRETTK